MKNTKEPLLSENKEVNQTKPISNQSISIKTMTKIQKKLIIISKKLGLSGTIYQR